VNVLITGGVGSGTTFIARMFEELGFDLGHHTHMENHRNTEGNQVRGVEHEPLLKLVQEWNWRLLPTVVPENISRISRNMPFVLRLDDPVFAKTQREEVQAVVAGLPPVVKQPVMTRYLGLWILAGGTVPDYVVVCMRDTYDQARSNVRDGFSSENVFQGRQDQLTDYGMLWETLHRYDIRYDVVQFPRSVEDADYLHRTVSWETLGVDLTRFTGAWDTLANPTKIQTKDTEAARQKDLQGHDVRPQLSIEKLGAAFDVFAGVDAETQQGVRDFVIVKGA
jgi:hypothetical protein